MAAYFCLAILHQTLQILAIQAHQHFTDPLLGTGTAEGQIRSSQVMNRHPLHEFGDDPLCIHSLFYHAGNRGNLSQIGFQTIQTILGSIRQWLKKKASGANAMKIWIDPNAKTDTGRRLFRNKQIFCQIIRDFPIGDFYAASYRLLQAGKPRNGKHALPHAATDIKLPLRIKRQIHMRFVDIAAYKSLISVLFHLPRKEHL